MTQLSLQMRFDTFRHLQPVIGIEQGDLPIRPKGVRDFAAPPAPPDFPGPAPTGPNAARNSAPLAPP